MNDEAKQLIGIRVKGVAFCVVCMLSIYGISWIAIRILQQDVFANGNYFIGFMAVEMFFVVAIIALLFSPKLFLSVITRIADKKIEEHTGCQDAIAESARNESVVRAVMGHAGVSGKVSCNAKGMARLLEYMQRIDMTVKDPKDFFEKAMRKDFARKYLNDITVLILDKTLDEKSVFCLRFLYAVVYDLADHYLVSIEDLRLRIKNMRYLLSKRSPKCDKEGDRIFLNFILSIMRSAFHQDDYKSVIGAYALMQGSSLKDAEVRAKEKSDMYEMVGVAKLYLQEKNAISYLRMALDFYPDNLSVLFRLAGYYFSQYDYINAHEYAARSFAVLPDCASLKKELDEIGSLVSMMLYMSAFALGRFQEAYETVVAMDEKDGSSATTKGNRAYLAFKCEKYDEAEKCVKQALELDPAAGAALNVMGMLFLRKGMYSNAAKAFIAASQRFKPNNKDSLERFFYGEVCNNCAVSLFKNSEQESARGWFDKAVAVCYPNVSVDLMDALPSIACIEAAM